MCLPPLLSSSLCALWFFSFDHIILHQACFWRWFWRQRVDPAVERHPEVAECDGQPRGARIDIDQKRSHYVQVSNCVNQRIHRSAVSCFVTRSVTLGGLLGGTLCVAGMGCLLMQVPLQVS